MLNNFSAAAMIGGMKVISSPLLPEFTPKIQTQGCEFLDPAFRAAHDAWLLETFGQSRTVIRMMDLDILVAHPNTVKLLMQSQGRRK